MKLHRTTGCTFCANDKASRDHVPAKCLFVKPYPSNLVTVNACEACQAPKEDEYFASILGIRNDAHLSATGTRLMESQMRRMERPKSRRFMEEVFANTKTIITLDENGNENEDILVVVDDRFNVTAGKYTRGLTSAHFGWRVRNPRLTLCVSRYQMQQGEESDNVKLTEPLAGMAPQLRIGEFTATYHADFEKKIAFWSLNFFNSEKIFATCVADDSPYAASRLRNLDILDKARKHNRNVGDSNCQVSTRCK